MFGQSVLGERYSVYDLHELASWVTDEPTLI